MATRGLEQRQRDADDQRARKPGDTPDAKARKTHDENDDSGAGPGTRAPGGDVAADAAASDDQPATLKKRGPAFKRPYGEPLPKAQDNFTDPDSRIMKTSTGFEQCQWHFNNPPIVEPPNFWIKRALGFQQFSFRGLEKVRCEFKLVCAALNLRRMATMRA